MSSRSLIVALVGAGTIAAAGAGSYLAVRSNAGDLAAEPAPAGVDALADAPRPEAPTTTTSVAVDPPDALEPSAAAGPAGRAAPPAVQAPPVERERATEPAPARQTSRRTPPARSRPASDPVPEIPSAPAEEPKRADVPSPRPAPPPPPPPAPPPVEALPPPTAAGLPMDQPPPRFEEVIIEENSVIGIRLDAPISTETARVEDKVTARVIRDLMVEGRPAIPAGSRLEGTVTSVDRGGKFRERARLGIRFTTLVLSETRQAIETDTIFREGASVAKESTSKVGASAVVGAILGAVVGGKKGAVIGGAAGAAGGTAAVMAGGHEDVMLAAGTPLTVRLTSPVTVLIERN